MRYGRAAWLGIALTGIGIFCAVAAHYVGILAWQSVGDVRSLGTGFVTELSAERILSAEHPLFFPLLILRAVSAACFCRVIGLAAQTLYLKAREG